MKDNYIITADWHLGVSVGHDVDVLRGIKELAELLIKYDAILILAGDVFHHPKPTPDIYRKFGEALAILPSETKKWIIDGNHDKTGAGRSAIEAYQPLDLDHVSFLTDFQFYKGDGYVIFFAPFKPIDYGAAVLRELERFAEEYKELHRIMIGHFDIPGAELGAEREIQLGHVDSIPSMNDYVDTIISGHIHRHQIFDYGTVQCAYPGSIARVSFSEEDDPKGFILFDALNGTMKFIERKTDRKFYTVQINWSLKPTTWSEGFKKRAIGNVIRLQIEAESKHKGHIDKRKIQSGLLGFCGEAKVQISYEQEIGKEAQEVVTGASYKRYEKLWVEQNVNEQKTAVTKKIKQILSQVESDHIESKEYQELYLMELEITNYQAIASAWKKFERNDCVGILGMIDGMFTKSNGSGKSSLIEAIRFGLYGVTRYSKNVDAIRDGEDEAYVMLKFGFGEQGVVRIERRLTESGSKATVGVGTKPEIQAKGSKEVSKWIENNFGVNQKTFDTIVYIGPTRHSIMAARPTERLKALQEPLPLGEYKKGLEIVKKERIQTQEEKIAKQGVVDELSTINFLELVELKKKILRLKEDRDVVEGRRRKGEDKLHALEKDLDDLEDYNIKKSEVTRLQDQLEMQEGSLVEAQQNVLKKNGFSWLHKNLKEMLKGQNKEKERVNGNVSSLRASYKLMSESIATLQKKGGACLVCGSTLTDKKRKDLIAQNEKDQKNTVTGAEAWKKRISLLEKRMDWVRELIDRIGKRIDKSEIFKERSISLKEALIETRTCHKKNKAKLNKIKIKNTEGLAEKLVVVRSELEECILDIMELNNEVATVSSEIKIIERDKKRFDEAKKFVKAKQKELLILDQVYKALSPKGIPQYICMALVDEMNKIIPEIIEDMEWWQAIDVWLESDAQKDELSVWTKIGNKAVRQYEGLSEGEREISNLILRAAYRKVLEGMIDLKYNMVLLDEALDALDAENLENALRYFKKAKMQSFCISHSNIKESFTKTMVVNMENDVAKVI